MSHFNLPRLPLHQYPRWGANTLNALRVVVEPYEDFLIAVVVLALDPTRADTIVGSKWMVLGSRVAGGVCLSAELLMYIQWEAVGIVLGGYGANQRTNWSGAFPGYVRV